MIVNRRTFTYKRGCQQATVELLKEAREMVSDMGAFRIYAPEIAPFSVVAIEIEFEDWAQYHAFWGQSKGTEEWWEKWYSVTETGGSNEVWKLI